MSRPGLATTRREMLVALLGLPTVLQIATGCRGRTPEPQFDGEFVDRDQELGHALRDGRLAERASDAEPERVRVLVLGAGIAGLTAAWQLRRVGVDDLRVLDLEDRPGGTARSDKSPVSAFPWGAHYLPAPPARNRDLVDLLRETGTVVGTGDDGEPIFSETHLVAAPKERVFHRGLWHEGLVPRAALGDVEREELRRFEALVARFVAERDGAGRRAFSLPVTTSSMDPALLALDRRSMADWLDEQGLRSPMLRWYVEYGCRDDFGTELAETSAWYGLHYFAARVEKAGEEAAPLLSWPEGNGFFVDHFVRRIGADKVLGGLVATSVSPEDEGRRVRVATWCPKEQRARVWSAERVIFALPSFLRSRVLARLPEVPPYDVRTALWLVANVHLADRPESIGFAPAWDNVIHGSRSLGYVVATHQSPRRAEGPTVWTWYRPFSGADERAERRALASLSFAEAADAVLTDLSRCHQDLRAKVRRVDLMRWGHGMVRPLVGTYATAARELAARPVGRVHFAHTDLSGVALFEEAFSHGVRAAREVARAL